MPTTAAAAMRPRRAGRATGSSGGGDGCWGGRGEGGGRRGGGRSASPVVRVVSGSASSNCRKSVRVTGGSAATDSATSRARASSSGVRSSAPSSTCFSIATSRSTASPKKSVLNFTPCDVRTAFAAAGGRNSSASASWNPVVSSGMTRRPVSKACCSSAMTQSFGSAQRSNVPRSEDDDEVRTRCDLGEDLGIEEPGVGQLLDIEEGLDLAFAELLVDGASPQITFVPPVGDENAVAGGHGGPPVSRATRVSDRGRTPVLSQRRIRRVR